MATQINQPANADFTKTVLSLFKKIPLLLILFFFGLISNAQNVGIGTNTPEAKLEVKTTGNFVAKFNGTGPVYLGIYEGDTARGYLGSVYGSAEDIDLSTAGSNPTGKLHLSTQGTPRLTINSSGMTGIGTTTPYARFQVINSTDSLTAEFKQSSENLYITNVVNITNSSFWGRCINVTQTNAGNSSQAIIVNHAGTGPGIYSYSLGGNGLWGNAGYISSAGVIGDNIYGEAVVGRSRGGNGVGAVVGRNDSSGYGVRGFNTRDGIGVLGQGGWAGSVGRAGVFENSNGSNPSNVMEVRNTDNAIGCAIYALQKSNSNAAVVGECLAANGNGVIARASTGSSPYAFWGQSYNPTGYAGFFNGNVSVIGTLSKTMGSFKIDHPQDPANKYLIHSFVESPDMMNIYNGNITTDAQGVATVTLPSYFEAENIDFRYQLTIMDENNFAQARVAKKIEGNQFKIITDKPGIEVSWMVTGVRNDAYAQAHRIVAEVEKTGEEKGTYLTPAEHGKPKELGINYQRELRNNTAQAMPALPAATTKLASDK